MMSTLDNFDRSTRLRRRRYLLLRVADGPALDVGAFFRGEIRVQDETRCTLLCPIRGESIVLSAAELALVMTMPADRWLTASELDAIPAESKVQLIDLARRGVVMCDPPPPEWADLARGEELLQLAHWYDLAAVLQAHSQWRGVDERKADAEPPQDTPAAVLELRRHHGEPPPHFVRREDVTRDIPLRRPVMSGPFFTALLARRTTRAFLTHEPLPISMLELMLYAVFGTHGIKHFEGFSAIKRTSPSGGALHPIEAYVLALNVQDLPAGLYHYETGRHALAQLEAMAPASARSLACDFTAGQTYFADAHALVVHVARFDRMFWKYAQHPKAFKAVLMDSAHLSQTFYLTAAHLGLGAFFTAAINDADIARRLRLPPLRQAAIGINGVGLPDGMRDEMHFVPDPYDPN